jgi:hypothetical protein
VHIDKSKLKYSFIPVHRHDFWETTINLLDTRKASGERVELREAAVLMGVITAVGSAMNIVGLRWAGLVNVYVMLGSPYWMGAIGMLLSAWPLSRTKKPALTLN